jgi:BirA family transcriptional regulator, biotin operon repressor / biotin---[acetyl-CoA-carboxylase] ligase|tara:strand:+ start:215 stop:784 length:570 start_codon:yes stop_codon:yes gene_type:complete
MKIKLVRFKIVKSTNDVALKLIKKENSKPSIVVSEIQTHGKGTMGKKWISKKGNLFISIFFEMNQKKINFRHFAILNAYLLKNVFSKNFSKKIRIKWPNDLLHNKKKICGILQEVINYKDKKFLVVGIGINTNFNPKNKGFSSTSLKKITNKDIDNNKVLNIIKNIYEKFLIRAKTYSYLKLKKIYKNI